MKKWNSKTLFISIISAEIGMIIGIMCENTTKAKIGGAIIGLYSGFVVGIGIMTFLGDFINRPKVKKNSANSI